MQKLWKMLFFLNFQIDHIINYETSIAKSLIIQLKGMQSSNLSILNNRYIKNIEMVSGAFLTQNYSAYWWLLCCPRNHEIKWWFNIVLLVETIIVLELSQSVISENKHTPSPTVMVPRMKQNWEPSAISSTSIIRSELKI